MANQVDEFNSFLGQAKDKLMCGTDCQQQKQAEQLKQDYLNAKTNLKTATSQVDTTEKNYITFVQGKQAYNKLEDEQLTQKATQIINMFQKNFNDEVGKILNAVKTHSGLSTNNDNVVDLYLKYKDENARLKKLYTNTYSDLTTNDRKTYYENQQIEHLTSIYHILLTIYGVTVIVYFISVFLYPSPFSTKIKSGIFVVLIILPFISTILLSRVIYLIYLLYNLLPKNVYKSI